MEGLRGKIVRGGFARISSQAVVFSLRIVSLMILARLLNPKDFGLVGMVTAVTGVLSLFKDAGLSMVSVQRASISEEQISTLFWVNIFVGTILCLLSFVAAPILVDFYNEPRLFWVTVALGFGFLFNAIGVQHGALLQREMRFAALSIIDALSCFIGVAAGIGMAFSGLGYWALVGTTILTPAVYSVLVWLVSGWTPARPHRNVGLRSMFKFGGTVTLNGLVVYIAYNTEKVLLGRYWGAGPLGIYGRAYQLANIPTENLNSAIGGVIFSALSRVQGEPERFRKYFLKGYSLTLSASLFATIACAVFADDIIRTLLGPSWKDAAPILRLLTPTVLIFGLINPLSWLLSSIGYVGRSLKISLLIAPVVIIAILLGLPHGPRGVAFAYSIAMSILVVPVTAWAIHGTAIKPKDIIGAIKKPFLSAMFALCVALGFRLLTGSMTQIFLRLALGGGLLAGVYAWMLLFVMKQRPFYVEILREIFPHRFVQGGAGAED